MGDRHIWSLVLYIINNNIIIIIIIIFIRQTDPITKKKQFKASNYKQQRKTTMYLHKITHLDRQLHVRANPNTHTYAHTHTHASTHTDTAVENLYITIIKL